MAKKKQGGKMRQQKRTAGKRLGVKVSDGEGVGSGMVLIRQRGTKISPGDGVKVGRDHTIYAMKEGTVKFGQKLGKTIVSVV